MTHAGSLPLQFAPDPRQAELMQKMVDEGCVTASPGTDVYEELRPLVDQGLIRETYCEDAAGIHQFQVTPEGLEAIA